MDVAIFGSGSWGTALAILLARNGLAVALYGRDDEEISIMRRTKENLKYLPGFALPEGIQFKHLSLAEAAPMTILAVPSGSVRELLSSIKGDHPLLVLATKGLEIGTGQIMSDIAAQCCPESEIAVLSGPNLATEIVQGIPTAALAACKNPSGADRVRSALMCPTYRVYGTDDVIGVELAGALKNVLAIGAGISDGLGFGDNTKGALLARGLKEMIQLGTAMGGRLETFLGIAGVGDLFATASSKLSRNYRCGYAVGSGQKVKDALTEIGQVAEGVTTAEAAMHISRMNGIQMPVFEMIENVLRDRLPPRAAVALLMERKTPDEGLDLSRVIQRPGL